MHQVPKTAAFMPYPDSINNILGGFDSVKHSARSLHDKHIAVWLSDHVIRWMQGLNDCISPYLIYFERARIDGRHLLALTDGDIQDLGVDKLGIRQTIIQSINALRELCLALENENLQLLMLNLCQSAYALQSLMDRPGGILASTRGEIFCGMFENEHLFVICSTVRHSMKALSWLDRAPFDEIDEYVKMRNNILSNIVNILRIVREPKEDRMRIMRYCCANLIKIANKVVKESNDPLVIQTASLSAATIRVKTDKSDLGLRIESDPCSGVHVITGVTLHSLADHCRNIEPGDEIVQIKHQIVVGWEPVKLIDLLDKSNVAGKSIDFVLKKPPRANNTVPKQRPSRLPEGGRNISKSVKNKVSPDTSDEMRAVDTHDAVKRRKRSVSMTDSVRKKSSVAFNVNAPSSPVVKGVARTGTAKEASPVIYRKQLDLDDRESSSAANTPGFDDVDTVFDFPEGGFRERRFTVSEGCVISRKRRSRRIEALPTGNAPRRQGTWVQGPRYRPITMIDDIKQRSKLNMNNNKMTTILQAHSDDNCMANTVRPLSRFRFVYVNNELFIPPSFMTDNDNEIGREADTLKNSVSSTESVDGLDDEGDDNDDVFDTGGADRHSLGDLVDDPVAAIDVLGVEENLGDYDEWQEPVRIPHSSEEDLLSDRRSAAKSIMEPRSRAPLARDLADDSLFAGNIVTIDLGEESPAFFGNSSSDEDSAEPQRAILANLPKQQAPPKSYRSAYDDQKSPLESTIDSSKIKGPYAIDLYNQTPHSQKKVMRVLGMAEDLERSHNSGFPSPIAFRKFAAKTNDRHRNADRLISTQSMSLSKSQADMSIDEDTLSLGGSPTKVTCNDVIEAGQNVAWFNNEGVFEQLMHHTNYQTIRSTELEHQGYVYRCRFNVERRILRYKWVKRWLVLRQETLYVFKDHHGDSKPEGIIYLPLFKIDITTIRSSKKFVFAMRNTDDNIVFHFNCADESTRRQWIQFLGVGSLNIHREVSASIVGRWRPGWYFPEIINATTGVPDVVSVNYERYKAIHDPSPNALFSVNSKQKPTLTIGTNQQRLKSTASGSDSPLAPSSPSVMETLRKSLRRSGGNTPESHSRSGSWKQKLGRQHSGSSAISIRGVINNSNFFPTVVPSSIRTARIPQSSTIGRRRSKSIGDCGSTRQPPLNEQTLDNLNNTDNTRTPVKFDENRNRAM